MAQKETQAANATQQIVSSSTEDIRDQPVHCPYRQAALIQQALAPDKMRVAFFLGAGCPMSIRVPDGEGTRPLIPDIAGLTARVRQTVEASDAHKENFATIVARLDKAGNKSPNVEEMLSCIRALAEVAGGGAIEGLTSDGLTLLDSEICRVTAVRTLGGRNAIIG